jgi:hypothetical protein
MVSANGDPLREQQLTLLAGALDDVRRENERLRDARGAVTRQLGPLPISAAAIAGLIAAFPGKSPGSTWQLVLLALAAAAFLAMLIMSMRYSALTPYREMRDRHELSAPANGKPAQPASTTQLPPGTAAPGSDGAHALLPDSATGRALEAVAAVDASDPVAGWFAARVDTELEVRGRAAMTRTRLVRLLRVPQARTLQEAFDIEWKGLFFTQLCFAAVVILLIAARLS